LDAERYSWEEIYNKNADAIFMYSLNHEGENEVIAKALSRAPKDVVDRVIVGALIVIAKDSGGNVIDREMTEGRTVIVINPHTLIDFPGEPQFCKIPLSGLVWMVLHEVAHFILGHKGGYAEVGDETNERQEEEANNLANEWFEATAEI